MAGVCTATAPSPMNTPTAEFHGDLVTSRRSIYTSSAFARDSLLFLQEAGSLQAAKPHTSRRSGLSSYLFFLVISGSGSLQTGDETYALHAGDCVFLDCSVPYAHTTSQDLWELKWVHFSGMQMPGIYRKFLERSGSPVFRPASSLGFSSFASLLDRLYELSVSDSYIRDMQLNEALASLLTQLMQEAWKPSGGRSSQGPSQTDKGRGASPSGKLAIGDVRLYLDTHYTEEITLDQLAERFHVNKYYLMRRFRQQYGTTVGSYVLHARIGAAKRLLRFSDATLEEAGARVGIPDANYFSRIFKKIEGVTPSQYRRSW